MQENYCRTCNLLRKSLLKSPMNAKIRNLFCRQINLNDHIHVNYTPNMSVPVVKSECTHH